jgi:hypothetical protein
MNRRTIDNRFQPEAPSEIRREVLDILASISGQMDTAPVEKAFDDVEKLFRGKFPGFRACNTTYHDLHHTLGVFLAMARLIHGAGLDGQTLTGNDITIGLIAALMHDVGYIQETQDTEGTGAKYAASHIERSIEFVKQYGSLYGLSAKDIAAAQAVIQCTDIGIDVSTVRFPSDRIRLLGKLLGTADLLAQLADRTYLEKLLHLYDEPREAGVGDYEDELDIYRKAIPFYDFVEERLEKTLGGVDRFMRLHFASRFNVAENLYRKSIENQKHYLSKILNFQEKNPRKHLKRRDILARIRKAYNSQSPPE